MRIGRRVDQGVSALVGWVESEVARHPDEPLSDYFVSFKIGSQEGCPTVDVQITNRNRSRSYIVNSFSLYHFPPIFKPCALSMTLDLMEKASSKLLEKRIPYNAYLPMNL